MISVEEALAHVLALAAPVRHEDIPLDQAFGRVLAEPAVSRLAQPPFDASAMDGYAVRNADLGDRSRALTVIGTSAAGTPFTGASAPGTAVRIFTGAAVPAGYDRVVMQENVTRQDDQVTVTDLGGGANIRPAGDDFAEGWPFHPGRRLTASDIGLLAAMNLPSVRVTAQPRVAILAGGDELVPPGTMPGPGQIVSSNDLAVAGLVQDAGGKPVRLPIARDTLDSLRDSLVVAKDADLVVTIGGASVGDHDLVARAAGELGMNLSFHKIAMRPGKPLMAGRLGMTPMVGLPGNPVSAIVCGILFLQPMILAMQGLPAALRVSTACLGVDLPAEGNRQHYLRARLVPDSGMPAIVPFDSQDSARLTIMADADALLIRPAGDPPRKAGDRVNFIPLRA